MRGEKAKKFDKVVPRKWGVITHGDWKLEAGIYAAGRQKLGALGKFFALRMTIISLCKHRADFGNDPAAGSPTATLLRLLLPLAEKYCLDL